MINSALVVLAYNEQKNLFNSVVEIIEDFNYIIIVNDNSKDKTADVINTLENSYKNVYSITNNRNLGAGKSFQIAIDYISSISTSSSLDDESLGCTLK